MINNPQAFSLTSKIKDCGHNPFQCPLCNRDTRFGFIAKSRKKGSNKEILVGLNCARHLHNPMAIKLGFQSYIWIDENKANLLNDAKSRRLTSLLITLSKKEPTYNFGWMIKNTQNGRPLSPAEAQLVISLTTKHELLLDIDLIKIKLRTSKEREQIQDLPEWQFKNLVAYMSPRQKRSAIKIRKHINQP